MSRMYFVRRVNGRIVAVMVLALSREYTGLAEEKLLLKMGFEIVRYEDFVAARAALSSRSKP